MENQFSKNKNDAYIALQKQDTEHRKLIKNLHLKIKELKRKFCETCQHEISSVCLDCDENRKGWEPKNKNINE